MSVGKDLTSHDLAALIRERGQNVLQEFRSVVASGVSDPKLLSILNGVKAYWKDSFRPALTSFCCEAVGGKPEAADAVSLMITLASAGGGIHDDLIDKSIHKHFRMTVLGLHGSDYGLLVGDHLIIKGWAMAAEAVKKGLQFDKLPEVIEVFGKWTLNVCEAEFMEISCRQNLDTDLKHYESILRMSMADMEGCAKLGAIVGDGTKQEVHALGEFASRLGFSFRLEDDLKDTLNKEFNLADRLRYESVPLPILHAAKISKKNYTYIKSILEKSPVEPVEIRKLVELCLDSKAFTYVFRTAERNARESAKALCVLKPGNARNTLEFMVENSLADIKKLCF